MATRFDRRRPARDRARCFDCSDPEQRTLARDDACDATSDSDTARAQRHRPSRTAWFVPCDGQLCVGIGSGHEIVIGRVMTMYAGRSSRAPPMISVSELVWRTRTVSTRSTSLVNDFFMPEGRATDVPTPTVESMLRGISATYGFDVSCADSARCRGNGAVATPGRAAQPARGVTSREASTSLIDPRRARDRLSGGRRRRRRSSGRRRGTPRPWQPCQPRCSPWRPAAWPSGGPPR